MPSNLRKIALVSGTLLALLPLFAAAQTFQYEQPSSDIQDVRGLLVALTGLIGWIFTFLIALAVFFVLYASFLYLTAGGESEKVSQANHILRYAAVAIAVAVLSKSIPFVVKNFVQNDLNGGGGSSAPLPSRSIGPGYAPLPGAGGFQPEGQGDFGPLPTLPIPGPAPGTANG